MARAHVRITTTTTRTRARVKRSNSNSSRKGSGQKRCPSCGRYMQLSSDHVKVKHKILEKDKFEFETLIDRMMLSEEEQQMMHLYYMKHKTFNEIADQLGYSEIGIAKMHQRIIKKIRKYIQDIASDCGVLFCCNKESIFLIYFKYNSSIYHTNNSNI